MIRNSKCPSITVSGGEFDPSSISLDMGIIPEETARKSLASTPETYTIISGLTEEQAQNLTEKIDLKNAEGFKCVHTCDKKGVAVTNQDEIDCSKGDVNDGGGESGESTDANDGGGESGEGSNDSGGNGGNNKPKDSNAGTIAGIIIAVVGAVIIIGVCVYFFVIKPRITEEKSQEDSISDDDKVISP
jgi:hypothetical protein